MTNFESYLAITAWKAGVLLVRLTIFTDYCLRVLMFTGTKPDALATIDDISKSYGISRNHIMKVVHRLGQLDYLTTVRGKGGGMRLAKPADAINLGRLVRETEEDMTLVECFQSETNECVIAPACALRHALKEGLDAFLEVLDGYTLDDLLEPQDRLRSFLAIPARI